MLKVAQDGNTFELGPWQHPVPEQLRVVELGDAKVPRYMVPTFNRLTYEDEVARSGLGPLADAPGAEPKHRNGWDELEPGKDYYLADGQRVQLMDDGERFQFGAHTFDLPHGLRPSTAVEGGDGEGAAAAAERGGAGRGNPRKCGPLPAGRLASQCGGADVAGGGVGRPA